MEVNCEILQFTLKILIIIRPPENKEAVYWHWQ